MNKKQIITTAAIVAAIGLGGAYGIQTVSAADGNTSFPQMFHRTDEERVALQAEREAEFETKLAEAVTAGEITETQKSAIIAKHDELQVKREALRDQIQENRESRRAEMQAIRTEMQDFLTAQGIDESVLPQPKGPHGGEMGMGGGMHRGQNQ